MTTEAAARELGVSIRTVQRAAKVLRLRQHGRGYWILDSDLKRLKKQVLKLRRVSDGK